MSGIVGKYCDDTGRQIKVGDVVYLDNHRGVVEGIFDPQTEDAFDYGVYYSGGIMVNTDEYGLMLIPFGTSEYITENKSQGDNHKVTGKLQERYDDEPQGDSHFMKHGW